MRKRYPTDLSDAEWNYIQPHLLTANGHGRPRIHDLREILNAIFYLLKSDCQWRIMVNDLDRLDSIHPGGGFDTCYVDYPSEGSYSEYGHREGECERIIYVLYNPITWP
jgi:Putative transposase of IS4/5 family (DUF4096)